MTFITFRLFAENVLQCEVSLSQQAAAQQKREKKKKRKEKSDEIRDEKSIKYKIIIEKTCALLNSGGGIVRMTISDRQALQSGNFLNQLDEFWKGLEPKLTSLAMPSTYDDVFDRLTESTEEILLFVKAPNHICTICYNLYVAGEAGVREASFEQVVKLLKKSGHRNRKSNVDVSINELPNVPQEFSIRKKCGFHESKQIQLKNYVGKGAILSNSKQEAQLRNTISAFANSKGGKIFLGIDDLCVVHGVNMQENNRDEIKDRVKSIITEHMIFPVSPREKIHWDIEFIPVSGCDPTQDLAVVVIKVAGIKSFGGVFMKGPKSYELRDGKVKAIEVQEWKKRMVSPLKLQTATKGLHYLLMMCYF